MQLTVKEAQTLYTTWETVYVGQWRYTWPSHFSTRRSRTCHHESEQVSKHCTCMHLSQKSIDQPVEPQGTTGTQDTTGNWTNSRNLRNSRNKNSENWRNSRN